MTISRYRTRHATKPVYEPGSGGRVLRNRLQVTRPHVMDQLEYSALLAAQQEYLGLITATTRFTAKLICTMHRRWLGGIYPWAGQYRTVEVAKGDFRWPPAMRTAQNMRRLSAGGLRRHTPCQVQGKDEPTRIARVADKLARVHAELLLIHPFCDGNGRLARWLADLMALQAWLPVPDYGLRGRGSRQRGRLNLQAVKAGYERNYEALAGFFAEALMRAVDASARA